MPQYFTEDTDKYATLLDFDRVLGLGLNQIEQTETASLEFREIDFEKRDE